MPTSKRISKKKASRIMADITPAISTSEIAGTPGDTHYFSVVSVVRNNIEGLKATKSSLDQQTCSDWEWLVIDGNSSDGSAEFAMSFPDSRIRAVSERDHGIYDAMNKGLTLATGEYVIFLNSGDRFASPTALAEAEVVLRSTHPGILFCSSIMHFGLVQVMRIVKQPDYIWHGQPGLHQATIFNRAEHVKFPYDTSFKICGDYDVITRMSQASIKMQSANVLFSENEFTSDATSGKNKLRLMREAIRAQRRNLKMSLPRLALSIARRIGSSLAAKVITSLHSLIGPNK